MAGASSTVLRGWRGFLIAGVMLVHAGAYGADKNLQKWIGEEAKHSFKGILANISPPGTTRGVVVASPSRVHPDYFYHWVRDAALTMDVVVKLYEKTVDPRVRKDIGAKIADFVHFSRGNQLTPNRSGGLGEPKFYVDGRAFNEEWGRPQNDGPALRAITLIRYAFDLLKEGEDARAWVKEELYDSNFPTNSVIKSDLEFISHHWRDPSFDLWEETFGQHFYTRLVQRRALLEGAVLADRLDDAGAADWYRIQAKNLEAEILKHWDPQKKIILATLGLKENHPKASNLDVSVVLGVLHAKGEDGFFSITDDRILATAHRVSMAFKDLYEINRIPDLGVAIGRYPEDRYDGYTVDQHTGNPWVLATAAYAELYYQIAVEWTKSGRILVTDVNLPFLLELAGGFGRVKMRPGMEFRRDQDEFQTIIKKLGEKGDLFLERIRYHTASDYSFSEQLNRYSGYMQGAHDLTWSYGAFLTAFFARVEGFPPLKPVTVFDFF